MTNPERIDVVVKRRMNQPAETVYDAWLDPGKARKFLFATATGQMVRAETDPRIGGTFTFVDRRDGKDFVHTGTYLELDRPRRIVFEFAVTGYGDVRSRISIDIQANGSGSDVTLTYHDAPREHADKARSGWTTILDKLASSLS